MLFSRWALAVCGFLAVQTTVMWWLQSMERPPAPVDLTRFPAEIGGWSKMAEEPLDPASLAQLGADRTLSWIYTKRGTGVFADLFVAWFQSQRGGATQPHSPQVCLPGNGWVSNAAGLIELAPGVEINRYIVTKGSERSVILYWYQTPRRVVAGEWAAKLWLIPDSIRDHRTDTSLVRFQVWNRGQSDDATTVAALEMARAVYPELRHLLPHVAVNDSLKTDSPKKVASD